MISPILSFMLNQNDNGPNQDNRINTNNSYAEFQNVGNNDSSFPNNFTKINSELENNLPIIRKRRISCQPEVPFSNLNNDICTSGPTNFQIQKNMPFRNLNENKSFDSLYHNKSSDDGILSIQNLLNYHLQEKDSKICISDNNSDYWDETNEGSSFSPIHMSRDRQISNSSPIFSIKVKPVHLMTFDELCENPNIVINPKRIGFIPSFLWPNENITFGYLVSTFFRKRNMASSKFPHKLYNALKIAECYPDFVKHVGIQWATNDIFRVDRAAFARLLGVRSIEGSLFHQQGNFPSHGFEELDYPESEKLSIDHGFGHVDLSTHRFLRSCNGNFNRYSDEKDINDLKWSPKPI